METNKTMTESEDWDLARSIDFRIYEENVPPKDMCERYGVEPTWVMKVLARGAPEPWVLVYTAGPGGPIAEKTTVYARCQETAAFDLGDAKRFRTQEMAELWAKDVGLSHFVAEKHDRRFDEF